MPLPFTSKASVVLLALASTSLMLGCRATVYRAPGAVVVEEDVVYTAPPAQIEVYPSVMYEGTPHYYADGRWYRRTSRGWGYYRAEPAHLRQRRPAAPPAERHEERHEEHREGHH